MGTEQGGALVEFAPQSQSGGMVEVASTRQAAEVQAAMVIAKKFPRDQTAAFGRIMAACRRKTLADQALYAYPRGGETVTGPSIRLAEALAQAWGNLDFGIVELEQGPRGSTVQAYAWDLETNTRQQKVFTVPHERHTRKGVTRLEDPRDVYELTANQGARRLRACILGVIPGDVVEAAVAECEKTMRGESQEPLVDRARRMVDAFGEFGVSQVQIEKRIGHKVEAIIPAELVQLKKVYAAIRDGMAGREDFFEPERTAPATTSPDLSAVLKSQAKPKPADAPAAESPADPAAVVDETGAPLPDPEPEPARGNGRAKRAQSTPTTDQGSLV
jgi:hypothetical protein